MADNRDEEFEIEISSEIEETVSTSVNDEEEEKQNNLLDAVDLANRVQDNGQENNGQENNDQEDNDQEDDDQEDDDQEDNDQEDDDQEDDDQEDNDQEDNDQEDDNQEDNDQDNDQKEDDQKDDRQDDADKQKSDKDSPDNSNKNDQNRDQNRGHRPDEGAKEAGKEASKEAGKEAGKEAAKEGAKEAGKEAAKEAGKEIAKEGAKEAASAAASSAAGGAAAGAGAAAGTAAGVAAGPVGWVVLALTLLQKIVQWIKKHPYETIAILVLVILISILPLIFPVVIIYAFIQGLWGWMTSLLGSVQDVYGKTLENITWGIYDYETNRDVSQYMKLLDKSDEDYEKEAKKVSQEIEVIQSEIKELEEEKALLKDAGESIAEIEEKIAKKYEEIAKKQEMSTSDYESQTRDMMFDMYDMTKDYFDELYVKDHTEDINGEDITLPTDLQAVIVKIDEDGNKYFENKISGSDVVEWINLPQKQKSKYLATTVYGLSEEILEKLYCGKLSTESGDVAESVVNGNTYYYDNKSKHYEHIGVTIERENLVTYYDMLGSRSIDAISFEGLKDYYTWTEETSFNKKDVKWYELNDTQKENQIKKLLRARLQSYVEAENEFWESNGDNEIKITDAFSAVASLQLKNIKGIENIIKDTLDDNGIKSTGYRAIETVEYTADIAFKQDGDKWVLYPFASSIEPRFEIASVQDFVLELLGINDKIDNIAEKVSKNKKNANDKVIYRENLFAITLGNANNASYMLYADNGKGKYVSIVPGSFRKFDIDDYVVNDGYLEEEHTGTREKVVTSEENGEVVSKTITETYTYTEYVKVNGKYVKIVDKNDFTENCFNSSYTLEDLNNVITLGDFVDKDYDANDFFNKVGVGAVYDLVLRANGDIRENMTDAQEAVWRIYNDGDLGNEGFWTKLGNWFKGDGYKTNQEKVNDIIANTEGSKEVDLSDINSVNEFMLGTNFELMDERELIKPYGIPSAFSYFVPLEESTRNIPFLIALAKEMKDTLIILSPLDTDDSEMKEEQWTYTINTLSEDELNDTLDKSGWKFFAELFGVPENVRSYKLSLKRTPIRKVVYAKLWDREIVNEFKQITTPNGINEGSDENVSLMDISNGQYTKNVTNILANQYIVYNEKPIELIGKYNVSLADVGIYEEVTGRPFLSQYTYDKITNSKDLKDEWKGAILEVKETLKPVESVDVEATGNYGLKYNGNGNVFAVQDGEVFEVSEGKVEGALYSSYVIIYHKEDKTYSMYSNMEKIDVTKGQEIAAGEKIGTYNGNLYFEYRQGGGDFKEFWTATPISVNGELIKALEENNNEMTPDGGFNGEIL